MSNATVCSETFRCGSSGAILPDTTSFALTNVTIGLPALIVSAVAALIALGLVYMVMRESDGYETHPKMRQTSAAIQTGAKAFLQLEYFTLAIMVCLLFALVSATVNWQTGICYLAGAITSSTCGYLGMMMATSANARTAYAATFGLNRALRVSFNSGSVMGLVVVSFGLGMISVLLMAFGEDAASNKGALTGFGFGASTVSIFARVGGGIFTKAADVGADLVGKNLSNIPEDDLRNPATIADNVGDNVGDVAGMGADLFSSFVGSCIASALLGVKSLGQAGIAMPYWICMSGIIAAIIGMAFVRCDENATQAELLTVLRRAMLIAGLIQIGGIAGITAVLNLDWQLFACVVIGLAAGFTIGSISEYFTSWAYPPTQQIAASAKVTAANVVISGLSVGMMSTILPTLIISGVLIAGLALGGPFGIALASTGLLSTLGLTLATDAYGPVADNAGGIAEMCHLEEARKNTDVLDALGNTTAAIGKGFACASAVLTAVSLLTNYNTRLSLQIDVIKSQRFVAGVLLGAMIPYWFAGMTMGSVNVAAKAVVVEVIRQFREVPGLAEGREGVLPDYSKCVTMITWGSLHAMVFPVFLVVLTPLTIGLGLGPEMLAGVILGAIVSGFMLGAMMAAAGGAWDNAKKYIEAGHFGGKRSDAHKAAVVGDTVGDPFKDTSGPALNILIKFMSYLSVTLVPLFKDQNDYWWSALIIIGGLFFFVPFWIYIAPDSVRDDTYNKLLGDAGAGASIAAGKTDAAAGTTAAAPSAASGSAVPAASSSATAAPTYANGSTSANGDKNIELQPLTPVSPTTGKKVTIHFAPGFLASQ